MLPHRNLCMLWLLLLLSVSGSAFKLNLFKRTPGLQDGDVRLFGSGRDSEGRVEVYHNGKWGTVCDDGWDMAEAQVVCRQLEFPGAKSVVTGKDYGQAPGPIWLDDLDCKGTENYLSSCSFKAWGLTDCSHKEDVGVVCETYGMNTTVDDTVHELDHSISMSDELGQIFDSRKGCDFHILAQSATGNKNEDGTLEMVETDICAHRLILSQFPLFNASDDSPSITVSMSHSCQPHFTSFIRYIYTRKIDVTVTSAQCLHWMASKFGMKQLMEDTGRLFSRILPEDASFQTQLSLYEYAEETGDLVLQENCIQYLAWNYQNLTASPVWTTLPVQLLGAILSRSDLVVKDEYFLLQTVENWIEENSNSTSLEAQLDLLNRVRFPMIPVENLYDLEINSTLYSTFTNVYREKSLRAFQFISLPLRKLQSNPKFTLQGDDYKPRIYTSDAWSIGLSPSNQVQTRYESSNRRNRYGYEYDYRYRPTPSPYGQLAGSFTTSFHYSLMLKGQNMNWQANIFTNRHDCSNWGIRCESFPVARFRNNYSPPSNIVFNNRLVIVCENKYVFQVQDFKEDLAYISKSNETQTTYPCPDGQYSYRFVVRPLLIN